MAGFQPAVAVAAVHGLIGAVIFKVPPELTNKQVNTTSIHGFILLVNLLTKLKITYNKADSNLSHF